MNTLGPLPVAESPAMIYEFADSFSLFDWGKMPDLIPRKGEALAFFAAEIFERLENPDVWKEYSKTSDALALRKANRFGGLFNEIGEELQIQGLETHYLGIVSQETPSERPRIKRLSEVGKPFRNITVREMTETKPMVSSVLNRSVYDYPANRTNLLPRLLPIQIWFRNSWIKDSGFVNRVNANPDYLKSIGFSEVPFHSNAQWSFPILEVLTKFETPVRALSFSEALLMAGISSRQLQDILFRTAWIAGMLRSWFENRGLLLMEGKLEWALSKEGRCILVDTLGPHDLTIHLQKSGKNLRLNHEFLKEFYQRTPWYAAMAQARTHSVSSPSRGAGPPSLPPRHREVATQLYWVLSNTLGGRNWFTEAWSLEKLAGEMIEVTEGIPE